MRDLLDKHSTMRQAADNLRNDGCELVSVFGFLWQYTACTDTRRTAFMGFRQLHSKFTRVAKQARALSEAVEEINKEFALPPETKGESTTIGAVRYSMVLPTQLRTYAFFLENGPAKWTKPYGSSRKWTKTDRLVLLATYVETVTAKKHYSDLTHLLDAAVMAAGQEELRDASFVRNTCRQFPGLNALLYRVIKANCETYAQQYPPSVPNAPPFIVWLESKGTRKN